jgi:hypothetical protein
VGVEVVMEVEGVSAVGGSEESGAADAAVVTADATGGEAASLPFVVLGFSMSRFFLSRGELLSDLIVGGN